MHSRAAAIGLLLVAMISIQFGASVAKQLFPLVGAEGATALRTTFAALILLAVWRPWRRPLSRRAWTSILLYGAALGSMNLCFYLAIQRIPLGITVALEFTGPLTVAVAASRRALDLCWALLALAGVLMILPLAPTEQALDVVGIVFALVAAGCWALYIIFGRRAGDAAHGGHATALGMLVAALLTLPVGISHAGSELLSVAVLPAALLIAVLSSALPYSLEMVALKRLPAKTFAVLMSLEPALAALFGFAVLGEHLTAIQGVAIACVITASAGSAVTASRQAAGGPKAPAVDPTDGPAAVAAGPQV